MSIQFSRVRIACFGVCLALSAAQAPPAGNQNPPKQAKTEEGGALGGKSDNPGLAGTPPTAEISKDASKKEATKREWRVTAQLNKILSSDAKTHLDCMLKAPKECEKGDEEDCRTPGSNAGKLIDAVKSELCADLPKGVVCPSVWLIQVLDLDNEQNEETKKYENTIKRSRVFLYHSGVLLKEFQGRRIFGEKRIGTLLIGRDAAIAIPRSNNDPLKDTHHRPLVSKDDLKVCFPPQPENESKKQKEKRVRSEEKGLPCGQRELAKMVSMGEWGGGFLAIRRTEKDSVDAPDIYLLPDRAVAIGQFLAAKKKQQAWLTNLFSLLSIAGAAAQGEDLKLKSLKKDTRTLYGGGIVTDLPVPSNMWVQPGRIDDAVKDAQSHQDEIGAQFIETFQTLGPEVELLNESRYFIDFSIGLPVKKIDELEYSTASTGGGVFTREIAAESVLGLFNLVLWKHGIDLENPQTYPYPRLLIGLGLRGRVLDRPFFGLGMGLGWGPLGKVPILREVQPYAGIQRTITQVSAEAAATGVEPSAAWKLAVGINVPVKSVADRLMKKKEDK